MKSFSLYIEKPVTPARSAGDYSAEEQAGIREAFASRAVQYRRRQRMLNYAVGGFCGCVVLGMLLPKVLSPWIGGLALVIWVLAVGIITVGPQLCCPGCTNRVDSSLARYCPQCGSAEIEHGNWRQGPRCLSCGQDLRLKARGYRIRCCTHCGVTLDETGL